MLNTDKGDLARQSGWRNGEIRLDAKDRFRMAGVVEPEQGFRLVLELFQAGACWQYTGHDASFP
jgi:hypothetical protein